MWKFFFALALFLLPAQADAQRIQSNYLPPELIRAVVSPGYDAKSLLQQVRFPRGSSASSTAAFIGNPNVTISAIGGSIATNRDNFSSTCMTPCFVQVSASLVTATGTSAPYEDLSYKWLSSDGCGPSTTRPTDGATVCSGTDQRSPEAVMRFDTAGTKTITLEVTGCAGGVGAVGTASSGICGSLFGPVYITKTITVNSFTGTDNYADCAANPGTATGSLANPWATPAQISAAVGAGNVAMHVKPGCVFDNTTSGSHFSGGGIVIDNFTPVSNIRIDATYPSVTGARPKFKTSGTSNSFAITINNVANVSDVVITDIDFENTTTSINGVMRIGSTTTGVLNQIYLQNSNLTQSIDCACSLIGFNAVDTSTLTEYVNYAGFWNVVTYSDPLYLLTDVAEQGSAVNWHFRVGGSVTGAGNSGIFQSQHIYPDTKTHGLWMWVTCGPTGSPPTHQRSYCFNLNWDGKLNDPTDHQIAQYQVVAENSCQYILRCYDLGNRSNNGNASDSTTQFQYIVISGNAMIGIGGADFQCGLSVTVRDNRMWGTFAVSGAGGGFYVPSNASQVSGYKQGTNLLSKVYRNKVYFASGSNNQAAVRFEFTWSVKQFVTDNWFVDARAAAELQNFTWSDLISSASVVDRNLYSSTTGSTTAWLDNGTGKSFALWQAAGTSPNRWDAAGSNVTASCPSGWTCPPTQWSHMN